MSKEVENIGSLSSEGILPSLSQDETFGINAYPSGLPDETDIKEQAYKEILSAMEDGLSNCAIITDGEYCGYACEDVHKSLRELEDEYENS